MPRRLIILLAALLPLAACHGPQSMFNTAGPAAQKLSSLAIFILTIFCVSAGITIFLLLWGVFRQRGSLEEHAPWNAGGGQNWVLYGGLVAPGLILFVVFIFSLVKTTDFPLRDHGKAMHPTILVIGHQWWWEVRYIGGPPDRQFTTANEIHIPVGLPVDIQVQSSDVIHAFWVPALHGKIQMIPGLTNYIRIVASRPGNYQGECTVYCGVQHAHMRLLVVAQPQTSYRDWRRAQLKDASLPAGSAAQQGEQVFMRAACPLCHTVRGLGDVNGTVGPDLTHLASRQYIGANSFPNDKADLESWVSQAQTLKPGCEMPDLNAFSGSELRDLTTFLRELK